VTRSLALSLALGGILACVSRDEAPPETRSILYSSQVPGGTEDLRQFSLTADSSSVLVAGDAQSSRSMGVWDVDSRRIAFVREFGDRDEIYVLDSLSGTPRRIGQALPRAVMFPDWSADGKTIAVSAGERADSPSVYFVKVESGASRLVLPASAASYRCPSWSPRGDHLVVASYHGGQSAIIVVDTLGVTLDTVLRSDSTYLDCPQFSPDGDAILLTVFHGGGQSGWERPAFHSNLAVVRFDDRRLQMLTSDSGLTNYARWSRDGNMIVFQSDRASSPARAPSDAPRMLRNLEIWVVAKDGTGPRRLTTNSYFDAHPSW
jgi:Tol biopolymer transport system component